MDYNNPNDPWFNTGYDPYKGLNEKERIKMGCLQGAAFIVLIIMGLLLCAMLSGCTTTKYVQVPVVHNDTTVITKHQRDSIWMHDSVLVSEKGDTVRIEKWHTQYVTKEVHDTLYRSKTDSIPYPVEVIKEVPAELTWWQQTRLHLANILLFGLLIGVIIWIGKLHLKMLGG
jgi:hypothetical protein